MDFKIDKHGQLNITTYSDIKIKPGEPDTLILTLDETETLLVLLTEKRNQ